MAAASVIGSYVPGVSVIHALDPRVKIALLFAWTLALFALESWVALLVFVVLMLGCALEARVPLGSFVRNLAPLALVLLVILLAGALRFDGSGAWAVGGPVGVDPEGLERGAKMVVRIVAMVLLSVLVTATTAATALTEALLNLMSPLRRCGVPVDDLATMTSIALRFIPLCGEQLDRVVMAQRARGARVGEGGPIHRVMSWVPVMIPLFVGLFRRSDALAVAMAARCYRGEGRTCLTTLRLRPVDIAVLLGGLGLALGAALLW